MPRFAEAGPEVGIDFVHFNGMSGELYMLEVVGAGVALFDYDGDGDLDLYVVQGALLGPDKGMEDALFPPQSLPPRDRLYRNDSRVLADGTVEIRFVDMTEEARIDARRYGMGLAVGDATGNGCPDLYVANYGPNELWRNNCDGTFTDITAEAGVDDPRWSVDATFFDMEGDGLLDLFVVNYVDFTFENHRVCTSALGVSDYCSPLVYRAVPDRLFRNRGGGRFEDVSEEAGILEAYGMGLAVVAADLDGNGRLDVYVANDLAPNQLWSNQGNGTFVDEAVFAGAAVNLDGQPEASMGIGVGDIDSSGRPSIFLTHLFRETNTLYRNLGDGMFEDATRGSGLGRPSWEYTGFGTGFFDYDNDGWLDVLVVNGAVQTKEALARAGDPFPLHEPNQLLRNRGGGRFEEVSGLLGEEFQHSEVSRGAAFGDVDNDGRVDVVISNNNGPLRFYLNRTESSNRWLGVDLRGAPGGREALGARVEVHRSDGLTLHRWVHTDGSYVAARDPRIVAGIGEGTVERVRIAWPNGATSELQGLAPDRYHVVHQPASR